MFGRGFGNGLWTGATIRPTARLAGKRLGQLTCCNAPDGKGYCFDTGTGQCVMTWISGSGQPGAPACVQDAQGQWVPPGCPGAPGGPPPPPSDGGRPCLPPGCRYVAAPGNPMQEVICECYNCDTGQSGRWQGMLGEFITRGSKNPCLNTPRDFPKPAQCPQDGSDYVPPPFGGCPPPGDGPPPTDGVPPPTDECPPGQVMSPWGCFISAIACPDEQGTYTIVEVDSTGGQGFQPTGRVLATGVSHGELQQYAHVVTVDDARCVPEQVPTPDGCPAGMVQRAGQCCTPDEYEISTTFDPAQPEGVCIARHQCFTPPDYTTPVGPPVEGGVDMSFCEAPPPDDYEGGLACPTDGTYDIYDAVTGEHIASGVAEADLPPGAELVAADDPRCGPPAPPPGAPPGAPGVPPDGFPGVPPGGFPGVPGPLPPPMGPGLPRPPEGAPIPTRPMPGMPAPQAPAQNPFTTRFVPCGGQPAINVRSLRTETLPSRPDSWQDQWSRI